MCTESLLNFILSYFFKITFIIKIIWQLVNPSPYFIRIYKFIILKCNKNVFILKII